MQGITPGKINRYIRKITKACGPEKTYIINLKWETKDEAVKKILEKSEKKIIDTEILKKIIYKGTEISIYKTGKIQIKNIEKEEQIKKLINDLLR